MAQENLSEILPRLNQAKTAASVEPLKAISESRSFRKKSCYLQEPLLSPLVMIFREVTVPSRGTALVRTDLSIGIPERTYDRIEPRSGLALKNSIDVGAGVMDTDYRGPVGVILFNHSDVDFQVKHGDRIAQFILQKDYDS